MSIFDNSSSLHPNNNKKHFQLEFTKKSVVMSISDNSSSLNPNNKNTSYYRV